MRILISIIGALCLLSLAPVPSPHIYRVRLAVLTSAPRSGLHAPVSQECTFEIATARLRQEVADTIGYPFGVVEAFSCRGDSQAVITELAQRVAAMQAEAAAYRAAHPIAGVPR